MNITLQQLKEIAKAGYGYVWDAFSEWNDAKDFVSGSSNTIYKLTTAEITYISEDEYSCDLFELRDKTFFTLIIGKLSNYIQIKPIPQYYFNHLAAIRKMEEFGLIEK